MQKPLLYCIQIMLIHNMKSYFLEYIAVQSTKTKECFGGKCNRFLQQSNLNT
jgi:hypothetical protein